MRQRVDFGRDWRDWHGASIRDGQMTLGEYEEARVPQADPDTDEEQTDEATA